MKSNISKISKINIREGKASESVRVTSNSTASLTGLADSTRELRDREFKMFVKLVNEYRKADKHADKWAEQLDNMIVAARTLSNREWKQTVKFAKTLRKADRELTKSELVEKRAKQERFNKAQQGA